MRQGLQVHSQSRTSASEKKNLPPIDFTSVSVAPEHIEEPLKLLGLFSWFYKA